MLLSAISSKGRSWVVGQASSEQTCKSGTSDSYFHETRRTGTADMMMNRLQALAPLQQSEPRAKKAPAASKPKKRSSHIQQRQLVPTARRTLAPKQGYIGLQNAETEPPPQPTIYRMSSSVDALLGAEFVQTLSSLHLTETWYAFVPSMLGENVAADAAAKAVVKAHDFCTTKTPTDVARSDSSYLAAINILRASLDISDSALVAVGLLYLYEGIMKDTPTAYFSHAGGISAILLARSRSAPATPLTRAVLYGNTHGTFQQPLLQGIASPFDDPYWLDFDPARTYSLPSGAVRLRKVANQSTIRLPGLIAKVRSLREDGAHQARLLCTANKIANELLVSKDESVENELLHRVALKETTDIFDKAIIRYSFEFKSFYEKETLLLYWGNRLMILKLCMELYRLNKIEQGGEPPNFNTADLDSEQERMVMSILMCWQDGFGFVNPLSMVWGALMGRTMFRGKPVEPVRSWVWTRYHDSLTGWPITYSMAEMDEESEEMAGGRLTGWIAKQDMSDRKKQPVK